MTERIPVVEQITKANDHVASLNRARLDETRTYALNLMASPGAGKTSLIEAALPRLLETTRVGVIEGDIATSFDAERTTRAGARSVQINTGGSCHLDAPMVSTGLDQLRHDLGESAPAWRRDDQVTFAEITQDLDT